MNNKYFKIHFIKNTKRVALLLFSAAVTLFSTNLWATVSVYAASDQTVVDVESQAPRSDMFISLNETLKTDGGSYRLLMGAVTDENETAVVQSINENYDPEFNIPVKYIDSSFVDAEKWDVDPESDYDSGMCWAASISNLFWFSGWANGLSNPITGKEFKSEDDVFNYITYRFTNSGNRADYGFEWLFEGQYYDSSESRWHTHLTVPGDRESVGTQLESDGLIKSLSALSLAKFYTLADDPTQISEFEKISSSESESVFQVSVGGIDDDSSYHSVNAVGIIIDESAASYADRYKAILIADSDNDGAPSSEELATVSTDEERNASRAKRTNSYTEYPLRLAENKSGQLRWEIVGFSDNTACIYSFVELPVKSGSAISAATETEGTTDSLKNPDFTVETCFTTNSKETPAEPESIAKKNLTVASFEKGEQINFVYYLQSRGEKTATSEMTGTSCVKVKYKVVRNGTETVAEGISECPLPIYSGTSSAQLVSLNLKDGNIQTWKSGSYEVFLQVNPEINGKREITESYCKNNDLASFKFTIAGVEPESSSESVTTSGNTSSTTRLSPRTGDYDSLLKYFAVALLIIVIGIPISIIASAHAKKVNKEISKEEKTATEEETHDTDDNK